MPSRSRTQKRVVWSFHVETSRWPSGWNMNTQVFGLSTWESVARREVCDAGADIAGAGAGRAAGDAGEVARRRRTMMEKLRKLV